MASPAAWDWFWFFLQSHGHCMRAAQGSPGPFPLVFLPSSQPLPKVLALNRLPLVLNLGTLGKEVVEPMLGRPD